MAIIPGVTINWRTSPRVITIPNAETEAVVDDLQDTLLDLEDNDEGIIHSHLRNTSGGENLGGGVSVGLTMELQDAVIAFEPETASISSGTVTTGDTNGLVLTDIAADFVTDLVSPGDSVVNFTDRSVGTILTIDSPTKITLLERLGDGVDDQFDIADTYKIFPILQRELSGGNIVAVDDVDAAISAVFPTFGTQIVRTSASSATLQELSAIQHSSYNESVTIDVTSSHTGIVFPTGTSEAPVNNLTDAKLISINEGSRILRIIGNITFGATDNIDGYTIRGQAPSVTTVTLISGVTTEDSIFENCSLTGVVNGQIVANFCHFENISILGGVIGDTNIHNCLMDVGTITFNPSATQRVHFIDCWSGVPGGTTPIFDLNGSSASLSIRNWSGGIELKNATQGQEHSFDFISGQIVIAASCTSGSAVIRGMVKITDNSGVGFTTDILGSITEVGDNLNQLLGIAGENVVWSATVFDVNNNMTSATITQYTDKTLVTPSRSWIVTATYNANSELQTYQLAEV